MYICYSFLKKIVVFERIELIAFIIPNPVIWPCYVLIRMNLYCQHKQYRKKTSWYIKCSFIQCHHFHCCSPWKPESKDWKTCSHLKSFHICLIIGQKSDFNQWKTCSHLKSFARHHICLRIGQKSGFDQWRTSSYLACGRLKVF